MSVLKEEVNESVHKITHLSTPVEGGATTENEHGGPGIICICHHPYHHSQDGARSFKEAMLRLGEPLDLASFHFVGSY